MRGERGSLVVEALVGLSILVVGVIGLFFAFDSARSLGSVSEGKQIAARRAEAEIERLRVAGWANLRLDAAPPAASDSRGTVSGSSYAPPDGGSAEALVVGASGSCTGSAPCVAAGPEAWSDGAAHGLIYRYITEASDPLCGSACSGPVDHRRITIAVTVVGVDAPHKAIVSSTLVVDPAARPSNTVANGNPVQSTSGNSIGASTGTTYYFSDSGALSTYAAPSADHATRTTAGASGVPDQLRTGAPGAPAAADHLHQAYAYSTDVMSGGGLGLSSSTSCGGGTPASAHTWVTPVIDSTAAVTATGNAALQLNTATIGGASSSGQLCATISDVVVDGAGHVTSTTALGSYGYSLATWPASVEAVTFPFRYLNAQQTRSLPAGHRFAVTLTASTASATGLLLLYDHPDWPSSVQLETQ